MKIYVLTLFPEIFQSVFKKSIIKRALDKKLLAIEFINIRNFGLGKHKQVDDKPYGGGRGMVMMVEPIISALESIKTRPHTVLLSASGLKFDQKMASELSTKKTLALICGHYEGVDARVEEFADDVVSIGNFIATGGEIPAMLIIDSITRLLPGVIQQKSLHEESFSKIGNYLEYPQYTRPPIYKGLKVPKVLQSGNHQQIANWRKLQSLKRTKKFRPDLLRL